MARREPNLTRLRGILNTYKAASGMTFDDLAAETGLARSTLTNIARGVALGDLRTWLLLADAFDTPLDELLAEVWR